MTISGNTASVSYAFSSTGVYWVYAQCSDADGSKFDPTSSGTNVTVSAAQQQDTTPPSISISHSPSGNPSPGQVKFTADASDASGIANITISVDENGDGSYADASQICTNNSTCSLTRTYSVGQTVRYYAMATDKANNVGSTAIPAGSFTVQSNSPIFSFSPSSYDFGNVDVGQKKDATFFLVHSSSSPSAFASGSIPDDAPFSCISGCTFGLSREEGQEVIIRFAPTNQGNFSKTLAVSSPNTGSAAVSGRGIGAVTFNISNVTPSPASGPAPLNNVKITVAAGGNAAGAATVRLDCTNDGVWEATETANSFPYDFNERCNYSAAGSYQVKVEGTRQNVLSFNFGTVTIAGGNVAVFIFTPSSSDFGNIDVGTTKDITFTLTHDLSSPAGSAGGSISTTAPFSCVSGCAYNLAKGTSQNVTIRFAPTAAGNFPSVVKVENPQIGSAAVFGGGVAAGTPQQSSTQNPPGGTLIKFENPLKNVNSFPDLLKGVIDFILKLTFILFPLMILIGGFFFFTSGGDPARVTRAKNIITWSIIGFAIVIFSKALIEIVTGILGGISP